MSTYIQLFKKVYALPYYLSLLELGYIASSHQVLLIYKSRCIAVQIYLLKDICFIKLHSLQRKRELSCH